MGSGASSANAHPAMRLRQEYLKGVVPTCEELYKAMQRHLIKDRPSERLGLRSAGKPKESLAPTAPPAQLGEALPFDEDEDMKPVWSSMDSTTWRTRYRKGQSMPPDRRLQEAYLLEPR
ncbi:unnamed protein product [Symbiodinium natans]|uniref:Uncharacterized protein n=1 Tax=Symbiodinium natans TaxID=878477 RepID=A0A812Q6R1_9DINO|nr:unnamed protein product [Symbiodinium natans]